MVLPLAESMVVEVADVMGGLALIFLIVIIVAPILVISEIAKAIQSSTEGRAIFRGAISPIRAKFFQEVFGLTVDEMKQLHFDDCMFHIGNGVPYWEVSSISCSEAIDVAVLNSELPHSCSWKYERVKGGPDRRYSNNPMTRTSRRFQILFTGSSQLKFTTYGRPFGDTINATLERFNNALSISKVIDLEAIYNGYEAAFFSAEKASDLLDEVRSKRSEIDAALTASRRLAFQKPALSRSMTSKQNDMVNEIRQFDLRIAQLQQELLAAQGKMKVAIQAVQTQISIYRDVKTMQSYFASKPTEKNSRQLQM